MKVKSHFFYGAIFSFILYLIFPELGLNVLIILASTVLIDFDHYVLYILLEKKLSLKKANAYYENVDENPKETAGRCLCLFHTIEFFALFVVSMAFLQYPYKNIAFLILIGILFHLLLDFIYENSKKDHKPFSIVQWFRRKDLKNKNFILIIYFIILILSLLSVYCLKSEIFKESDNLQTKLTCDDSVDEKIKMQIENAGDLDALLVLGGGRIYYHRTNQVYKLYKNIENLKNISPYIVLTGNHSGFYTYALPEKYADARKEYLSNPDSEIMKEDIMSCGIPEDKIYTENKSLDTFANLIYAKPILEQLNAKKIGLVTDDYHMRRAMWISKEVLGNEYTIYPFPAERKASVFRIIMEDSTYYAQKIDVFLFEIDTTSQQSLESYLETQNPFHARMNGNKAPISLYNIGISFYGVLYQVIYGK